MDITAITPTTDFAVVKDCIYKGEHYSVRDNGAIFRHARDGKPKRKNDEFWTFGKKDPKNGYMYLGSHRVHIIVANAFHGAMDSKVYVVDHIDTNRCNNRPENLRWLTRLENALLNPITCKKIEFLCGSIENFINDPSCLRDISGTNQDVAWMRTVSKEEAKACYDRIMNWVSKPSIDVTENKGMFGEWLFKQPQKTGFTHTTGYQNNLPPVTEVAITSITGKKRSFVLRDSLTSNALQGDWNTPTEFMCCPVNISSTPIENYYNNLKKQSLFSRNSYWESVVLDFALSDDKQHLWVLTEDPNLEAVKRWGVTEIVMHDNRFLHLNRHTFFEKVGGRKYFTLEQGKEWTEGDCMDDFC